MNKRVAVVAFVTMILTCSTAHAGKVSVTPPLLVGSASQAICCIANLDSVTVSPLVEIVSAFGVVAQSATPAISAGGINCIVDSTPFPSTCRVSNVSPKKVRVTYCMADSSDNCLVTVTAPFK